MKQAITLTMALAALTALTTGGAAIAAAPAKAPAPASVNAARMASADKEAGNWMSHGRTYDEQRFSPLKRINDGNVGQLGLAWTAKLDVDRGVEATPIVVDGVMYTTGPFSIVYAYDARNGKLLWKYDPQVPRERAGDGCCDVVNRGVAVWEGKVYLGSFDGRLIAIDARTGRKAWETDTVIDRKRSYTITGAPRVVKGKVLIGNGGAEYGVRGYVSAFDAKSGKLAWRFFTVPGDPNLPPEDKAMAIARPTWFGDQYAEQGGGGTVWDAMAYDPKLNLLYIGVGNGSVWNRKMRSEGKGDNLFIASIVALNPDDGSYVWHYQQTPGDMWDYTSTQHIILADLPINGRTRKVLMQAPKNGFFYVLDRATGELLSAEKYFPGANWATHIDMKTGRPVIDEAKADWTQGPKRVAPGPFGAHNWHPMSFNPQTGLVYIPMQENMSLYAPDNEAKFNPRKGTFNLGAAAPKFPEDPKTLQMIGASYKGKLLAWDPVRQKAAWSQDYRTMSNGGTLSTAGNLVFQGSADGRVLAYAADSGKKLWESPANTGVMAGPVTYEVEGEQYVTFMAGWGGSFPLMVGLASQNARVRPEARVLTYKLGGTATLPAPRNDVAPVPQPPALTADAQTIDQGRGLFNATCANCHGMAAVGGGVIPDLRYLSAEKHGIFAGIVAGALAYRGMPAFADMYTPDEVSAIHQYIVKRAHDLKQELKPEAEARQ
ncbi:MAG: PQQ-dependent dehydrogenase, methanol/ethanol family [Pseudomonadota bacterium]